MDNETKKDGVDIPNEARYLTLDLTVGEAQYTQAMQSMLSKIKVAYPNGVDPRKTANLLITETFQFVDGLLPGINLQESTALFGAVMGLGTAGHISDGVITEQAIPELISAFASSYINTVPSAIELVVEAKRQAEGTIIDPNKLDTVKVRPTPKKHGPGKRKKK